MSLLGKKSAQGFSLIELLIVVAIVGVLTAVALPSYENYRIKVNIAEAQRYALALTAEAQAFYDENDRYPGLNSSEWAIVPIDDHDAMRGYSFWSNSGTRSGTDGNSYAAGQIGTVQIYFHAELYPGSSNLVRLSYDILADNFGNGDWLCVQHYIPTLAMDLEYQPGECQNAMRFQ